MDNNFLGQNSTSEALDADLFSDEITEESEVSNQKYERATYIFSFSKLFERASYYGLRSLIVLYMTGEVLQMSDSDALSIYGWFTFGIIASKVIGAIFGDLIIGNRKAIIIGGFLQAIGAFILSIPNQNGFFFGIILVAIGGGLYSSNLISEFGKLYLRKTKIIDSGFTIFFIAINIGAFIGPLTVGYIGDFSYSSGFVLAGILMVISTLILFLSKNQETVLTTKNKSSIDKRVVYLFATIVIIGIFWSVYEVAQLYLFDLQSKFAENTTLNIPRSFWRSNSYFVLPIGLIAVFAWARFYSSQVFKLTIGFISAALSYGVLFLIPSTPSDEHIIIYFGSVLFMGIAEVYISPVFNSIITKNSNPKYLAIVMSLVFIPLRIIAYLFSFLNSILIEEPQYALTLSTIITCIVAIGLFIFYIKMRKSKSSLL